MSIHTQQPIALALSGGGIRAMVFHLGILRNLAEDGLLEKIGRLSTVSGGSLIVGLIFRENDMCWPSSRQFKDSVYPALRRKLCEKSLQWGALRQLLRPRNIKFLLSRSNLLASALQDEWGVSNSLSALPQSPEWSINGTNAENGRRFRFKRDSFGDYRTGYADASNFPLASAMAVSAAFPGGFGPLQLEANKFIWKRRAWGAPAGSEEIVEPDHQVLHLYDGGVYDNLGLEPFFDAGFCASKVPGHFILVSDAGMPLPTGFSLGALNPFRLKRVADIMADQSHALRVRTFHHYLRSNPDGGSLLYIASPSGAASDKDRSFAASFPTTLRRLHLAEFDSIAQHGYSLAKDMQLPGAPSSPSPVEEGA